MPKSKYKLNNKGQIIIYYGDGKGKTTAALGAVLRAVGAGWNCTVFQFIKGPWPSAEREAISEYIGEKVIIEVGGKGFVKIMGDKIAPEIHQKAARELFEKVKLNIKDNTKVRLIILDELLDAIELGFISEDEVADILSEKPTDLHIIITGHKKFKKILDLADLITEMKKIKHPFDQNFLAIKGLDY